MKKLGDVIREHREKLHLSQTALGKKAHCSQQTIGKIENYLTRKPANLPNIAKALGTNSEAILAEVTEETVEPTRQSKNSSKAKRKSRSRWPFKIDFELYDRLTDTEQLELESLIFLQINKFLATKSSIRHGDGKRKDGVRSGPLQ